MIVPTLADQIDALVIEADVYVDPYQGGEDVPMCFCDTAVCSCAVPLNGIISRIDRAFHVVVVQAPPAARGDLDELPF